MLEPYDDLADRWLRLAAGGSDQRSAGRRPGDLPPGRSPAQGRSHERWPTPSRCGCRFSTTRWRISCCRFRVGSRRPLLRDKILLRRAVEGVIPATTATRRKQAFATPIGAWLRGDLRPALTDLPRRRRACDGGVCSSPSVVSALLDEHLEGAPRPRRRPVDPDGARTLAAPARGDPGGDAIVKIAAISHLASPDAPTGAEKSLAALIECAGRPGSRNRRWLLPVRGVSDRRLEGFGRRGGEIREPRLLARSVGAAARCGPRPCATCAIGCRTRALAG